MKTLSKLVVALILATVAFGCKGEEASTTPTKTDSTAVRGGGAGVETIEAKE